MALTTNRKNKIIAEWKAGAYPSLNQLAAANKVDPKTVARLTKGISQSNAQLVEIQTALEIEKKALKSPQEVAAINREVEKRTNQAIIDDEIQIKSRKILKKLLKNIESGISSGDYTDAEEILTGARAVGEVVKTITPKASPQVNVQNNISVIDPFQK
jgi:hypothetical protein